MSGEIQKANGTGIQRAAVAPLEFTPDQRKMIRDSFLNGASEAEASVLMELARLRRLNPITRQIHFVKRWDGDKQREVWSAQVGIDGFRSIAERTGLYDGQDEPEYEYDSKGALRLCRVRVYRKDWSRPVVGVAHFSEYAQSKKDGSLTKMWATKPHVMVAKCAEALAFRKAFPEDTSGLYAPEEMPDEREVNPPPGGGGHMAAVRAAAQAKASAQTVDAAPEKKPEETAKVNVWPKVKAMLEAHELRGKPACDFLEKATGKTKRAELDEDDVGRIQSALAAEYPEPPPPGDGDAPITQ